MSRSIVQGVLCGVMLATAVSAMAQEEKPTSFVYGTYFYCDASRQGLADDLVASAIAPVFDAAVEDGTITAWAWMAHQTGGKWRRLLYFAAPTTDATLAALESVWGKVDENHPEAARALQEICPSHDDYIWQWGAGSTPASKPEARGDAGFSVYMDCDMSREDRADEIVEEVFAPVYNRYVAEGKLTSWGWLKHFVGGKWRRLSTTTAADQATLLNVRNAIIEEIVSKHADAGKEFDSICGSHQDYMWGIQHETP